MKKRYVFQTLLLICLTACGSKDEFDATGTFEATEIVVSSEATGKLFYLNAEEGMHFTQGTEVGLIDTVQLYLKKRQLEAQMKSVENQRPDIPRQIAATKAQIATAQRERNRVENLLKAQAANLPVKGYNSGPLGGDQQIGAKIVEGKIDFVIFFSDPLTAQPHDPDVKALLRIAQVYDIPIANNKASADFMITSPLMDEEYEHDVVNFRQNIADRANTL